MTDQIFLAALASALAAEEVEEDDERRRRNVPVQYWGAQAEAGSAPTFLSAEIGTVNGYTIVVTFSQDVSASNYGTGVTIKVNTVATTITSATRQANHAVVRYVIPIPYHGSGDTITWEYTGGNIVGESGGVALATVTAQTVTNNITWAALLDLQAEGLSNGALSTWTDQSGNGRNFTQAGGARPTVDDVDGYKAVVFDGVDDSMDGSNFADNLSSFEVMTLVYFPVSNLGKGAIIAKANDINGTASPGWYVTDYGSLASLFEANFASYVTPGWDGVVSNNWHVLTIKANFTVADCDVFIDGVSDKLIDSSGIVDNTSNSEIVRIGTDSNHSIPYSDAKIRAILIFSSVPGNTDRAALETRVGARYGLTVP